MCVMQGVICSGFAYYLQGVVMKDRGPVFVTAFNPLCMIMVAVLGSVILAEEISLGRYGFSDNLKQILIKKHKQWTL